jgi:hypothetical protein
MNREGVGDNVGAIRKRPPTRGVIDSETVSESPTMEEFEAILLRSTALGIKGPFLPDLGSPVDLSVPGQASRVHRSALPHGSCFELSRSRL